MTCSLHVYRVRIGMFLPTLRRKSWSSRAPKSTELKIPLGIIILMTIQLGIVVTESILTKNRVELDDWKIFNSSAWFKTRSCDGSVEGAKSGERKTGVQGYIFDPGIIEYKGGTAGIFACVWLSRKKRNKLTHVIHGNRGQRGSCGHFPGLHTLNEDSRNNYFLPFAARCGF